MNRHSGPKYNFEVIFPQKDSSQEMELHKLKFLQKKKKDSSYLELIIKVF